MALTDNLRGYWNLDESSGNAADSSGNGYTLTNTNTVGYASALINNGGDTGTSNSNKRFLISNDVGITNGAMSMSIWAKMRAQPGSGGIATLFDHRDAGTGNMQRIQYYNEGGTYKIQCTWSRNGIADYLASYSQEMGTTNWWHIVMTFNGSTENKLYVNGTLRDTAAVTFGSGSGISDGTCLFATANGFLFASAYLDEAGIWSRALSSTEVTSLYNGGAGLAYPFSAPSSAVKSVNSLAKASVKSKNGLAVASIKNFNGLA